jgi:hypothetical protein
MISKVLLLLLISVSQIQATNLCMGQASNTFHCFDDTHFQHCTGNNQFVVSACPPGLCATRSPANKNPCVGKSRAAAIDGTNQKSEPSLQPSNSIGESASSANDPGLAFRAIRTCPDRLPPAENPDASVATLAPMLGAEPGLTQKACSGGTPTHQLAYQSSVSGKEVPCDCPPAQTDFNNQFAQDHGRAVPLDGSVQSQIIRLNLAVITLQNSFCCPASSTTLASQRATL